MKNYLSTAVRVMLVIGLLFAVSMPASALAADKPIELSFSYTAPPQASLVKAIIAPWSAEIEEASGGKVKILQHPGGTLVKSADAYDAVATGLCDLAQIDPEENPGRFPLTAMNSLPFFYPDTVTAGVVAHELLNKYTANTEFKEIKILIAAPLHMAQYLGNKPVATLADFKGLRLRSSGKVEANTVQALGAIPIEVGTGELASALDKKTVDGCFFTLSGAFAFGLKDVTRNRTMCNVVARVFWIGMNKDKFNKLPADIQKIFEERANVATTKRYAAAHAAMEKGTMGALIGIGKKMGLPPFVMLSKEERAKWRDACKPVWDEWVGEVTKKGLPGKAMMDDALSMMAN